MNNKYILALSALFLYPQNFVYGQDENKTPSAQVPAVSSNSLSDAFKKTLEKAYDLSPESQAARENFKRESEQIIAAIAKWKPTIGANASQTWSQNRSQGWTKGNATGSQRSVGIELKQNLFDSGATTLGFFATKNKVMSQAHALNAKQAEILLKALKSLSDCLVKEIEISIYEKNIESSRKILRASENKLKFGEETRTNVEQARAQLAKNEADLLMAKTQLIELDEAYFNLTNSRRSFHAPSDLNHFADSSFLFSKDFMDYIKFTPQKALDFALKNNPRLQSALCGEEAAKYAVGQTISQFGPSVDLRASTGASKILRGPTGIGAPNSHFTNDKSVTLSVSIPLYSGGTQISSVRSARAGAFESEAAARNTRDQVRQTVLVLFEQVKVQKESIELYRKAVKANGLSMQGMQQEIAVGSKSVLDIIEIQNRYLQSQLNLARAASQYWMATYQYLSTLGVLDAKKMGLNVDYFDPLDHYKGIKWLL